MDVDEILKSFASLTGDAVGVGFRGPDDPEARTLWVNQAFVDLFEYQPEELIGKPVSLPKDPAHYDAYIAHVKPQFEAGQRLVHGETYCLTKSGRRIWTSVMIFVNPAENGRFSTVIYRDITDLKNREIAAERALALRDQALADATQAQSRLMASINAVPDPIAIWDSEYRLAVCNDAFAPRLLRRQEKPAQGSRLEDVLRDASQSGAFVDAAGRETDWHNEAVAAIRGGHIRDLTHYTDGRTFLAVSHDTENGDKLIISSDITEIENERRQREAYARQLEDANEKISRIAVQDDLTGLGNRRFLSERFLEMRRLRSRKGGELAALHIDLDRFKQVNDTMGHAAGDFVLCHVAERLRQIVRADDVVARIGGDEFVILLHFDPLREDPRTMAKRLVEDLSQPIEFEEKEICFGASVGVSMTPTATVEDLLENSDIALYKAKYGGRAQFSVFGVEDRDEMAETKALADDIIRALETSEFLPVYQPQIDATSNHIVGLEVLARWQHPKRGLLRPAEFLSVANDLNCTDRIDRMVYEKALGDCVRHFEQMPSPPGLSFNVSAETFLNDTSTHRRDAAQPYRGQISFELLETTFLEEENEQFFFRLDQLREDGFAFELDNFGSGRASLVALQRVAPDRLKIDRRLVDPIVDSEKACKLVRSIVGIGQALGIGVTAEGVETAAQARMLREMGCDRLQGYYFSRPETLEGLAPLFRTGPNGKPKTA